MARQYRTSVLDGLLSLERQLAQISKLACDGQQKRYNHRKTQGLPKP